MRSRCVYQALSPPPLIKGLWTRLVMLVKVEFAYQEINGDYCTLSLLMAALVNVLFL